MFIVIFFPTKTIKNAENLGVNFWKVAQKKFNRIVVWQNRGVTDIALDSIAGQSKTIQKDDPLIQVAQGLGIYVGETS